MTRVSRGLFGTERAAARVLSPSTPAEATERAMARLREAGSCSPVWREREEWARMLYRGDGDFYGRRIYSGEAKTNARWVAWLSARVYRGKEPTGWQWGHLETTILKLYEELNGVSSGKTITSHAEVGK